MKYADLEKDEGTILREGKGKSSFISSGNVSELKVLAFFAVFLSSVFQRITIFKYENHSKSHILHYWLESCCVAVLWFLYSKQQRRSLLNSLKTLAPSLWPLLVVHILNISVYCLDLNNNQTRDSGGSVIYQISISVAPAAVLASLWYVQSRTVPIRRSIYTMVYTCLMLISVCGNTETYLTFREGLTGVFVASLLGLFLAHSESSVNKVCLSDVFLCLNSASVVILPCMMIVSGEMKNGFEELFAINSIFQVGWTIILLGLLNQLTLIACLWQVSVSGPLMCVLTQNLSWIVRTVYIPLCGYYGEMFITVSSFRAMWVALLGFLVYVLDRRM